jgi:glycosyltransferase involved in cell wall biosynthesis
MKIGILGTRGIPNHYGGFEQLAEYLSCALVKRGHQVTVYCSSLHPFKEQMFKGVRLIKCKDPEDRWGTIGQFVYDLRCILHSRKAQYDILLQLGYTSSSVWAPFLPASTCIITNMDGLEWKRAKYAKPVQWFLKQAERWAVKSSDALVADSPAISDYLFKKYQATSHYIAYGATVFHQPDAKEIDQFQLKPYTYALVIARYEPENNIEMIIEGFLEQDAIPLLVLMGNHTNTYGTKLHSKWGHNNRLRFQEAIYEIGLLNQLRYFSAVYFHGHSAGGTNPSLLEAMASGACICAHRNVFNEAVLKDTAFYFTNANEVAWATINAMGHTQRAEWIQANRQRIHEEYTWEQIVNRYEQLFIRSIS